MSGTSSRLTDEVTGRVTDDEGDVVGASRVVAVDGPSGSGKSSTARGVARRLGCPYLDTGAMYRATTWAVLRDGADLDDPEAIDRVSASINIVVGTDPSAPSITVDGTDVATEIRGERVTTAVSPVSAVPAVRERLVAQQRAIIDAAGHIVVEGRDIASVVAPDAPVKVYLVADVAARAARRTAEQGAGSVEATRADLARRDAYDSTRASSPLRQADGAVVVDTTHLTLEQVVDHVVAMVPTR